MNLYNDNDPKVCAWASELVKQGHVAPGTVLCKSIKEVQADELRQATQVHLFAGILGWPLALRLAGWPDDEPVWTGSCPCQAESVAGKRLGAEDSRHLWPDMHRLIREHQPATVFGEQVERASVTGWIDRVRTDLEAEGYAFGFHVLGAHSVGAWHIRQRIYWVAHRLQQRVPRLVQARGASEVRPWWPSCKANLQHVIDRPFDAGAGWPQPLVRAVDDGIPARVVGVHGAGNAIVPQVAARFIQAFVELVTEAA